jgi:transcriptional regulator with XRE-family HTH domain
VDKRAYTTPGRYGSGAPPLRQRSTIGKERPSPGSSELGALVGLNLRRIRTTRGLSLERLARASGVSRAMLSQIELAQSAPTITTLWKIARALNCQLSALITSQAAGGIRVLRAANAKILTSRDGKVSLRALFACGQPRLAELYELRLAPLAIERAEPQPAGTVKNLVVSSGSLEIAVGDVHHTLVAGDAIQFEADGPHEYRNAITAETVIYLVMTHAETPTRICPKRLPLKVSQP